MIPGCEKRDPRPSISTRWPTCSAWKGSRCCVRSPASTTRRSRWPAWPRSRRLLDLADRARPRRRCRAHRHRGGYQGWAPTYDDPGNQLIDIEGPIVREILASLPVGVALDAACGTGRHAAYLAELGHRVIGVDSSPEMLSVAAGEAARRRAARGGPARAAGAGPVGRRRGLRAGADARPRARAGAGRVRARPAAGRPPGRLRLAGRPRRRRLPDADDRRRGPGGVHAGVAAPGERLPRGRTAAGLRGAALRGAAAAQPDGPSRRDVGHRPGVRAGARARPRRRAEPWALHAFAPEATNAAYRDLPVAIIWHFQLR